MTTLNDVVLVYMEDEPVFFARVESILPDVKKDWFQIKLLVLQVPLQVVTWILRDAYINGETFQMNGKAMRLEKVESPMEKQAFAGEDASGETPFSSGDTTDSGVSPTDAPPKEDGRIISFSDFKKKQ